MQLSVKYVIGKLILFNTSSIHSNLTYFSSIPSDSSCISTVSDFDSNFNSTLSQHTQQHLHLQHQHRQHQRNQASSRL
jgi:hypothetical protein